MKVLFEGLQLIFNFIYKVFYSLLHVTYYITYIYVCVKSSNLILLYCLTLENILPFGNPYFSLTFATLVSHSLLQICAPIGSN